MVISRVAAEEAGGNAVGQDLFQMPRPCAVEPYACSFGKIKLECTRYLTNVHQSYQPHELHFAYCYRVYQRFRTHGCRPYLPLASLKRSDLDSLMRPYNIRVLECASDYTDVLATLSLQPLETIAAAADKLKGRVSKWLREELRLSQPTNLLSKGYFASTIGSRKRAVENYLSAQSEHHGYAKRRLPPVFVGQYELDLEDLARVSPKHAAVVAQFHLVMATSGRREILGSEEGKRIAAGFASISSSGVVTRVLFSGKRVGTALFVATNVRLHGRKAVASGREFRESTFCSRKREAPRRKAVASERARSLISLAASMRLHGTRPWHPKGRGMLNLLHQHLGTG